MEWRPECGFCEEGKSSHPKSLGEGSIIPLRGQYQRSARHSQGYSFGGTVKFTETIHLRKREDRGVFE